MSNTSDHKQTITSPLEENRVLEWISRQGKNIIYGLAAFLVLLIVVYQFSTRETVKNERDYLQASNDFTVFTRASNSPDQTAAREALLRLDAAMKRFPELHAAYDGTLAQQLLNQGQIEEARPYAISTLERTKSDELPFYAAYAETTLLISDQHYQAALDKATVTQQQMLEAINNQLASERSFGEELFAFNLLRIAMLQQQLGNNAAELQTWQAWKQYAGLDSNKTVNTKVDPLAFRAIIQQLAIGSFSLPDYIAHREKVLEKLNK